ncbi:MAG TPA: LLM class F420-dependent oxidoreductase [Methylomirabilota bacterium]|nr:LLM class F420-dependent oxidoreductase [Methylomirabilota bacterium]
MRFGLFTSLTGATWDHVLGLWRHVEATGWDAACVTDHFMPNTPERTGDVLECWTTLAALAALVPRLRVGTIVSGNTYRHPAVLAKMAAQVDIVSGGRLICGIGAGWQQNEHEAYGLPFATVGERLGRLDEACQVLTALWTQDRSTFKGRFYELADAPLSPKPVQRPHPELMIGGGGEKVTLRIAARHADHWNVWGGPRTLRRKAAILDRHCAELGRDPRRVTRSANMLLLFSDDPAEVDRQRTTLTRRLGMAEETAHDTLLAGSVDQVRDTLGRLQAAGVDMLWIPTMFLPRDPRPLLDRFVAEVAPAFR